MCKQPVLAVAFSFLLAFIAPTAGAAEISFSTVVNFSAGPHSGAFSPGDAAIVTYELDPTVVDTNVASDAGIYPGATLSLTIEFPDLALLFDFVQGTVQTFDNTENPDDQVFIFGAVNQNNSMLGGESVLSTELDFIGTTSMLSSDALPSSILSDLTSINVHITTASGFTQVNFSTDISPTTGDTVCELTVGSEQVIVNFDLTSQDPMPPYTNIQFGAAFDSSDPVLGSDRILTFLYGGPNGTDLLQTRNDAETGFGFNAEGTVYGPLTTANPIFDPMLDGVFSIGFQMTVGTTSLQSVTVAGQDGVMVTPDITTVPCAPTTVTWKASGTLTTVDTSGGFITEFPAAMIGTPFDITFTFDPASELSSTTEGANGARFRYFDALTSVEVTVGGVMLERAQEGFTTIDIWDDFTFLFSADPPVDGFSLIWGLNSSQVEGSAALGLLLRGPEFLDVFTGPGLPNVPSPLLTLLSAHTFSFNDGSDIIVGDVDSMTVSTTTSSVPADDCTATAGGCNPTGGQEIVLPDNFVVPPGATITQTPVSFVDPRADANGRCDGQTPLMLFDGALIIPPHLCGSPEFEVLVTEANFEILEGTVESTMFPEVFVSNPLGCDRPIIGDPQLQDIVVWQADDSADVIEGRALELTFDCGSSRGRTRRLSFFVVGMHIDFGIDFDQDPQAVTQAFIDLTSAKIDSLMQAVENAKPALENKDKGKKKKKKKKKKDNDFDKLKKEARDIQKKFDKGQYDKASRKLESFLKRAERAEFDTDIGFNHQGNLISRASNIKFTIDEKIIPFAN